MKEGGTNNDIFAFLTTEPNAEVGATRARAYRVVVCFAASISKISESTSDLDFNNPLLLDCRAFTSLNPHTVDEDVTTRWYEIRHTPFIQ